MSALVFPSSLPGITIDIHREIVDSVDVQPSISGKETRYTESTYPLYRYTLNFEVLRSSAALAEFQKLAGFYVRHRGRLDSFLFTDDEDSVATAKVFGVGDGATTDFQLQRTLVADADLAAAASRKYWPTIGDGYEPIFDLNGSPSIFKDAVLQTITTNYTLPGNGVVHFVAAPANGVVLTFTGNYYRRCRFENDNLSMDRIVSLMWSGKSISIISVKV